MRIPVLVLEEVSAAKSYKFLPAPGDPDRGWGSWAICTINDATGELTVQSDWGNWCYRWGSDPKQLGAPNLTAFIARREAPDYIVDKLLGRDGSQVFSPDNTVKALRRLVLERRREDAGRNFYTRNMARAQWDALGSLLDCDNALLFQERFYVDDDLSGGGWSGAPSLSERLWDDLEYERSNADQILRDGIVPALIKVLNAEGAR